MCGFYATMRALQNSGSPRKTGMSSDEKRFRGIPIVESGQKYETDAGFAAIKNGVKQRRDSVPLVRGDKPRWLRAKMPSGSGYSNTRGIVHEHKLSTVCEESMFFMKQGISRNDVVGFIKADAMFHKSLFEYANHSPVWDVISGTRVQYVRFLMLDMGFPNRMDNSLAQHVEIVRLVGVGDENSLQKLLEDHHDFLNLDKGNQIRDMFAEYFN